MHLTGASTPTICLYYSNHDGRLLTHELWRQEFPIKYIYLVFYITRVYYQRTIHDIMIAKYGFYFECKRKIPEKENDGVTTRHVVDRNK